MTTPLLKKTLSSFITFLLFGVTANAQKNIARKVTDVTGNPLADVTAQVNGTSKLTATSRVGNYSIVALDIGSLVFTFAGNNKQLL